MARYTGPMTKKSRRLGIDLVGGDSAYERRPYPPGQHGRGRIKESEYLLQLREKQKARYTYGVLEKQFHRYYAEARGRAGAARRGARGAPPAAAADHRPTPGPPPQPPPPPPRFPPPPPAGTPASS